MPIGLIISNAVSENIKESPKLTTITQYLMFLLNAMAFSFSLKFKIRLSESKAITGAECIKCGHCIEVCPNDAFRVSIVSLAEQLKG